jgi:hypothetical protein
MGEDMPSNIARFEQLMYLSLGIGIVIAAMQYPSLSSNAGAALTLSIQASTFGIMLLFIWLIARRHANWARWVFLVISLAGLLAYIPVLGQMLRINPFSGILSMIQFLIQAVAFYLVFTGNAVAWFKRPPRKISEN